MTWKDDPAMAESIIEALRHNLKEAEKRAEMLAFALERIRDCNFTITLPDRMDAVRQIAREALE